MNRHGRKALTGLVLLLWAPVLPGGRIAGAQDRIEDLARSARDAIARRDLASLVRGSAQLRLQLPGAEPSAALGGPQAAAALAAFLRRDRDQGVTVAASGMTGGGTGFVELHRQYRVAGSAEVRTHRLLLAYRRSERGWELVEVRVVP